jgi:hypothetical protein
MATNGKSPRTLNGDRSWYPYWFAFRQHIVATTPVFVRKQ